MLYNFNGVIFDDVNLSDNDDYNDWSQVCEHCVGKHKLNEQEAKGNCFIDRHSGNGICGIEGCENEADHYIDFSDDVLQVITNKRRI
jgi:hypothetical protein